MTLSPRLIEFDPEDSDTIRERAAYNAATGGPNSGFEIQGLELFDEETLANTFPELKEDIDLVVSTESYVRQLSELHYQIQTEGGMSRGLAMELHRLVPDTQSFNLQGFTEDSTQVNYDVSLEAISATIMSLIAAAVVILIGLIWKFISWLFRRGGSTSGKDGDVSRIDFNKGVDQALPILDQSKKATVASAELAEKSADILNASKKVHLDIPVLPGLKNSKGVEFPFELPRMEKFIKASRTITKEGGGEQTVGVTVYELLNARINGDLKRDQLPNIERPDITKILSQYFRRPNPILMDGMTDGQLAKKMEAASNMGEVIARILENNFKHIVELDRKLHKLGSSQDYAKVVMHIESIQRFDNMRWMGKSGYSLQDIVRELKDEWNEKNVVYDKPFDVQKAAEIAVNYTRLNRRADFYTKSRNFIEVLAQTGNPLQGLLNVVEDHSRKDDGQGRYEMFARMRGLITQMIQDAGAACEYFKVIDDFERANWQYASATHWVVMSSLQHLARYYTSSNMEIPRDLLNLMEDYNVEIKSTLMTLPKEIMSLVTKNQS